MSFAGLVRRSLIFINTNRLFASPFYQRISSRFASNGHDKYQHFWSEEFDSVYSRKMPKSKEFVDSSSDASSSHSSSEDEKPRKKQKKEDKSERSKPKEDKAETSKKAKKPSKADEEEPTWEFGGNKRLKIRTFKGKLYVDIREYYEKGGEFLPGKKGISLPVPVFDELMGVIHEVEDIVKIKAGR